MIKNFKCRLLWEGWIRPEGQPPEGGDEASSRYLFTWCVPRAGDFPENLTTINDRRVITSVS